MPEATPGEKHRAFTVNCEWGSLASWLETLLPEDELPSASSSGHGTTSSWSALGSSSSTVRKGELGMWGWRLCGVLVVAALRRERACKQALLIPQART